jgi:peroxiredoxin
MTQTGSARPLSPLEPGQPAPDFTLPAINREGEISLADYRGRSALLLALFRGLYCPFCRRAIAQLGVTADKLRPLGVETLAVVATAADRARLYFRYRPTRVALAADPELATLRAYHVPKPELTPELVQAIQEARIDASGALPRPVSISEAAQALDRQDGFEATPADRDEAEKQFPQQVGQFLLDRSGILRWVNIEAAREGPAGIGKFPSDEEFLAAAGALRR